VYIGKILNSENSAVTHALERLAQNFTQKSQKSCAPGFYIFTHGPTNGHPITTTSRYTGGS